MDPAILNYVNRLILQRDLIQAAKDNLNNADPVIFKAYDGLGNEIYMPNVLLITGDEAGIPAITMAYKQDLINQMTADIAAINATIAGVPCDTEPIP